MLSIVTPGNEIDMFIPEGFYSDVYQLIDRCNRMIERNQKDAGTIVDTKLAYDATSRKISVNVKANNVVTLSSDLASIMAFLSRRSPLEKKENTRGRSLWTRTEDSIVYTSIAMRLTPTSDFQSLLSLSTLVDYFNCNFFINVTVFPFVP